jgi:hypothetical protein
MLIFPKLLSWRKAYSHCPLRKRGWTLQERELFVRSVLYTEQQMIWECQSFQATEKSPVLREHDDASFRLFSPPSAHPSLLSDKPVNFSKWYDMVERYTRRQLSYQTDRLPAIPGLAEALEGTTGITKYVAGLWDEDLLEGLLWCVSPPNRYSCPKEGTERKCEYPSWSWASVNDPVVRPSKHLEWAVRHRLEDGVVPCHSSHIEPSNLEPETVPFSSDPRGRTSESSLRVEGF